MTYISAAVSKANDYFESQIKELQLNSLRDPTKTIDLWKGLASTNRRLTWMEFALFSHDTVSDRNLRLFRARRTARLRLFVDAAKFHVNMARNIYSRFDYSWALAQLEHAAAPLELTAQDEATARNFRNRLEKELEMLIKMFNTAIECYKNE